MSAKILVVDDDPDILGTVRVFLKQRFTYIQIEGDPQKIPFHLDHEDFDAVLLDMNFAKGDQGGEAGLSWLSKIIEQRPGLAVIMMTAYGDINLAVDSLKNGATDFILKPWKNEKLFTTMTKALNLKHRDSQTSPPNPGQKVWAGSSEMIGKSESFLAVLKSIEKVAPTDANVLITGENGTGKELAAKAIHKLSSRAEQSFIPVDLGALSQSLFESELFGHIKGAFTDAKADKVGRFEMASGGTIFLDEIGNIPLALQGKLLTVIQSGRWQKVGSSHDQKVDVRIIAATNVDLSSEVDHGNFRQDLLYRLNTIEIEIPALRDRQGDISLLTQHFLSFYSRKYKKPSLALDRSSIKHLEAYKWPGNIRELQHTIERAVIMHESGPLTLSDFALSKQEIQQSLDLKENEKKLIQEALLRNGGNITHAARALGIDRLALYRRMEKYGI